MKEVGITNTIQTKNPGKNAEQTPDGIPENQDSQYHWQEEEIKKKKGNINRDQLSNREAKCEGLNLMATNQKKKKKCTFSPVNIFSNISLQTAS